MKINDPLALVMTHPACYGIRRWGWPHGVFLLYEGEKLLLCVQSDKVKGDLVKLHQFTFTTADLIAEDWEMLITS